jgi:hypothetical protein
MRFKEDRPFATPEAAERKLLELANVIEADHAGRLSVAVINKKFREAGGSYEEYRAAVTTAICTAGTGKGTVALPGQTPMARTLQRIYRESIEMLYRRTAARQGGHTGTGRAICQGE